MVFQEWPMNHLIRLSVSMMIGMWLCIGSAFAQEIVDVETYAGLQNCMAEADDVVDNGSYDTYCMEAYELAVKAEKENKMLNSNTIDTE